MSAHSPFSHFTPTFILPLVLLPRPCTPRTLLRSLWHFICQKIKYFYFTCRFIGNLSKRKLEVWNFARKTPRFKIIGHLRGFFDQRVTIFNKLGSDQFFRLIIKGKYTIWTSGNSDRWTLNIHNLKTYRN